MPLSPMKRLPSGTGKRSGLVAAFRAANSSQLKTRPGEWNSSSPGASGPRHGRRRERPRAAHPAPPRHDHRPERWLLPDAGGWGIADPLAFGHASNLRVLLQPSYQKTFSAGMVAVRREIETDDRSLGEHEGAYAFLLDALHGDDLAFGKMQRHIGRTQDVQAISPERRSQNRRIRAS